jgi:hypothetical protein
MNGADFGIRFRAAVEKPAGSLARTVTLTPLPRIRRALSAVSTLACSASASFSREQHQCCERRLNVRETGRVLAKKPACNNAADPQQQVGGPSKPIRHIALRRKPALVVGPDRVMIYHNGNRNCPVTNACAIASPSGFPRRARPVDEPSLPRPSDASPVLPGLLFGEATVTNDASNHLTLLYIHPHVSNS